MYRNTTMLLLTPPLCTPSDGAPRSMAPKSPPVEEEERGLGEGPMTLEGSARDALEARALDRELRRWHDEEALDLSLARVIDAALERGAAVVDRESRSGPLALGGDDANRAPQTALPWVNVARPTDRAQPKAPLRTPLHAASPISSWLLASEGPTPLHYVLYRLRVVTLADVACLADAEICEEPLRWEIAQAREEVQHALRSGALVVQRDQPAHALLTRLLRPLRQYLHLRRVLTVNDLLRAVAQGGLCKARRGCPIELWAPVQTLCVLLRILPPPAPTALAAHAAPARRAPRQRSTRRPHHQGERGLAAALGSPDERSELLDLLYELLPADGRPLTTSSLLAHLRQASPQRAALVPPSLQHARRLHVVLERDPRFRCEPGGLVARERGSSQLGLGEQLVVRVLAAVGPRTRTGLRRELFQRFRYYATDARVLVVLQRAEALGLLRRVEVDSRTSRLGPAVAGPVVAGREGRSGPAVADHYQALCRPLHQPQRAPLHLPPTALSEGRERAWRKGGPLLW